MSDPIRVLNIIGGLMVGGAQRRLIDIHRHLDPDAVQFDYLVGDGNPGALEREAEALGGRIYRVPWGLALPRAFGGLVRELEPDVVHGHMHYASAPLLLLSDRAGVPVRVAHFRSSHDGKASSLRRRAQRSVMRAILDRHATDIVAVSNEALDAAWIRHRGVDDRCQVIYNGLDFAALTSPSKTCSAVRDELSVGHDVPMVVHLGRFHAVKNHLRLVEVFARVHERRPDAVLVLAGDGEEELVQAVRRRVSDLGIEDVVRMPGVCSEVVDLLHAADLLVLPSKWEGLPGVVIEARAAGLPVVASDLGSVREIAAELGGITALSLEESDDRWASAILDAATDSSPETRAVDLETLEASAFSMDRCIETLMGIWTGDATRPRGSRTLTDP